MSRRINYFLILQAINQASIDDNESFFFHHCLTPRRKSNDIFAKPSKKIQAKLTNAKIDDHQMYEINTTCINPNKTGSMTTAFSRGAVNKSTPLNASKISRETAIKTEEVFAAT